MARAMKPIEIFGRKVHRGWLIVIAILVAHLGLYALGQVTMVPLALSAGALCILVLITFRHEMDGLFRAGADNNADDPTALQSAIAESVLAHFPDPILVLDGDARVVLSNGEFHPIIANAAPGRMLSSVFRTPAILDAVTRILDGGEAETIEFETPGVTENHSQAHCVPLARRDEEANDLFVLIVVHDLTAVRRVDQMRVDFIANVSHELKTPLASLVGFIDTLLGPARDDEEAREKFLAIMQKQSTRMGRLVDDLLSLSRIELNEHVPPTEKVLLKEVIEEVISNVQPVAQEQGVSIELSTDDELPAMLASRDQMFQVFQNLIVNAVKYGGRGNSVEVSVFLEHKLQDETGEETVRVDVTDHGPGIAREHIPRLTERFYRVDENQSRTGGGTGLGLAIVKHIVARHRGQFSIQSMIGKGSTFSVVMPVSMKAPED